MNTEEQIRRLFDDIDFRDEPPMEALVGDYVARGQKQLIRRRAMTWAGGVAGVAAVATGVMVALPGDPDPGPAGDVVASGPLESGSLDSAPPWPGSSGEFPATRALLNDTAAEHFDPSRDHLSDDGSFHGGHLAGIANVGTKIGWTVPGESGEGMVFAAVTEPGYASVEDYAREGFADLATGIEFAEFTKRDLPGTEGTGWVAEDVDAHGFGTLEVGVVYERADGSLVGVGVYDTFGNNSEEAVSGIAVSLAQAAAFVTDRDLQVAAEDIALEEQWAALFDWLTGLDEGDQRDWLEQLKAEDPEKFDELRHQDLVGALDEQINEWGLNN